MNLKHFKTWMYLMMMLIAFQGQSLAQTTSLSHYYPSPFGTYEKFKLSPLDITTVTCDATVEGLLVFDDAADTLKICINSVFVPLGGVWEQATDRLFPSNTDTNPDLRVGVGTSTPESIFSVVDEVDDAPFELALGNLAANSGSQITFMEDNANEYFHIRYHAGNNPGDPKFLQFWGNNTGLNTDRPALALEADYVAGWGNPKQAVIVGPPSDMLYTARAKFEVHNWGTEDIMKLFDNANEVFTVKDGGNIGIGETDPQTEIHVTSDTGESVLKIDSPNGTMRNYTEFHLHGNTPAGFTNDFSIFGGKDFLGGTWETQLVLNQDGDFGIGLGIHPDTEPDGKFIVGHDDEVSMLLVRNNPIHNVPETALALQHRLNAGVTIWNDMGTRLEFEIQDNSGTVHPIARIEADREGASADWGALSFHVFNGAGNPVNALHLSSTGWVGVGTNAPTRRLWVNGTSGGTDAAGWHNDSDERLKKNIKTISNALDKTLKLRGVEFEWKDPKQYSEGKHLGVIAQEIQKAVPEVVSQNGDFLSIQLASLTAVLIEAFKELKPLLDEQMNQQTNDIKTLKQELEQREQLLNQWSQGFKK